MDLPPKFFMSAHSGGAVQTMIYVSRRPERIEGLFLQSPAGVEDQFAPDFKADPYNYRFDDQVDRLSPKYEVDGIKNSMESGVHPLRML